MFATRLMIIALLSAVVCSPISKNETIHSETTVDHSDGLIHGLPAVLEHFKSMMGHGKRQQTLYTKLQAIFHYNCPESGAGAKTFEWAASFNTESRQLIVAAVKNIDKVDDLIITDDGFGTHLHHRNNVLTRVSCCSYTYTFQTIGAVFEHSIAMQITTVSMYLEQRPSVKEYCVSTDPHNPNAPPICAASNNRYAVCPITSINVSTPNN